MPDPKSSYSFAYQPVADVELQTVKSFEALVRGPENQPAGWLLDQFSRDELLEFDSEARRRAIALASKLEISCHLNLNLLTGSLDADDTILEATLQEVERGGLSPDQIVLEISETEAISDHELFLKQIDPIRACGVRFALDDFGAGFSGLNLLAEFQPDIIKLDLLLVRDIERRGARQAIVRGVIRTCEDLGIDIVAEGVETIGEYEWLRNEGIVLYQGFLFARPAFEQLPTVVFPPDPLNGWSQPK